MDQDAFRRMLLQPSTPTKSATSTPQIAKNIAQPAFKPRKVKKSNQKYRDRAAERREGIDNHDYAQIESVLEDLDSKTEPQQNANDDDSLEQAFQEVSASTSAAPKKRTRGELIRELKEKRTHSTNASSTDDQNGKLKGKFKPIGAPTEKKKLKPEGERRKKKKKVDVEQPKPDIQPQKVPSPSPAIVSAPAPEPESEPDEDLDIFAGAGEYDGLNLGDDDDEGTTGDPPPVPPSSSRAPPTQPGRWFLDEEPEPPPLQPPKIPAHLLQKKSSEENAGNEEESTRLVPLASSALPSIREFLAMDDEVAKAEKKRKRKEKKKEGEGKNTSVEGKLDRDYKRLKSYTEKKGGSIS